jgi:hypothetical protein
VRAFCQELWVLLGQHLLGDFVGRLIVGQGNTDKGLAVDLLVVREGSLLVGRKSWGRMEQKERGVTRLIKGQNPFAVTFFGTVSFLVDMFVVVNEITRTVRCLEDPVQGVLGSKYKKSKPLLSLLPVCSGVL